MIAMKIFFFLSEILLFLFISLFFFLFVVVLQQHLQHPKSYLWIVLASTEMCLTWDDRLTCHRLAHRRSAICVCVCAYDVRTTETDKPDSTVF
ncbi:hypothetical protein Btru_058347 [Bulinus truncatus]|nr:hypothetical protein Btru_058347 [Bulinus truncatus]